MRPTSRHTQQTVDATTQYEVPDNAEEDKMEESDSDDEGDDADDPEWHPSQEDFSDDSLAGDEEGLVFDELLTDNVHTHNERKFVVFESCLRQLFSCC